MRNFVDHDGQVWTATARRREGPDYKGRYYLVMRRDEDGLEVALPEVRWNSERTAERTLQTMSEWELRRRLRAALARTAPPVGPIAA